MKIFDTIKNLFNKQPENDDTPLPEEQEELETFNTPLPEDYIDQLFKDYIEISKQYSEDNTISDLSTDEYNQVKSHFTRALIQPIKDDICSFDLMRSPQGLDNFIKLTDFNINSESVDDLEYFNMLKYHISNVPVFGNVYDCIEIYQNYSMLISPNNPNFNTKGIVDFTTKIDNASIHLSNNNLANMYYYVAEVYDTFLFTIKQKDGSSDNIEQISNKKNDYLLKALRLTNDPKKILSIKEALPSSANTTSLVRKACARALDDASSKSHNDNFTAYKTLGDTYYENINSSIGFKRKDEQKKERINAYVAKHYYERAIDRKLCSYNQVEKEIIEEKIASLKKLSYLNNTTIINEAKKEIKNLGYTKNKSH